MSACQSQGDLFGHPVSQKDPGLVKGLAPSLSPHKSVGLRRKAENMEGDTAGRGRWPLPSKPLPCPPPADLLLLAGLASSVFVLSELLKLCEKFCSGARATQMLSEAV